MADVVLTFDSSAWKASAIIAASMMSFTQALEPLASAPVFGAYIDAFDCTLAQAIQTTGIALLILGFSNYLWVPLSDAGEGDS